MIRKWLVLCVLFVSWHTAANTLTALEAQRVLQMPASHTYQEGVFEQKKYFKVLKKPFVSSGKFIINEARFSWQTLKPMPSGIEFDEQLYLINSVGERQVAPQGAHFAKLLVAMLKGELESLTTSFVFKQSSPSCITLNPIQESIKSVLGDVAICSLVGDKQISFTDQHGNRTEITLTYQQSHRGSGKSKE